MICPSKATRAGDTALHLAARNGHAALVEALLQSKRYTSVGAQREHQGSVRSKGL